MPDGRRAQHSTKETKRKAAQAIADEWEKLSKERAKAKQAHKVISAVYKAAHGTELPDATSRGFLNGWVKRRKGEIAPSSYVSYSSRIKGFLNFIGPLADAPMAELDNLIFWPIATNSPSDSAQPRQIRPSSSCGSLSRMLAGTAIWRTIPQRTFQG